MPSVGLGPPNRVNFLGQAAIHLSSSWRVLPPLAPFAAGSRERSRRRNDSRRAVRRLLLDEYHTVERATL
jgi:hypothetical protein